jgi:hypothetical protein
MQVYLTEKRKRREICKSSSLGMSLAFIPIEEQQSQFIDDFIINSA